MLELRDLNTVFITFGHVIKPPLVAIFVAREDDHLVGFGKLFEYKVHGFSKPIIIAGHQRVIEYEGKMNSRGRKVLADRQP